MAVGVDTGGTFTDVVVDDGRVLKVPSTPRDPSVAVVEALRHHPRPDLLAHGTTVATNALLERRGARVALVTTHGFADVIEIARQDRPALYDQWADRPEPLVPRGLRLEVAGRLDATGAQIEPLPPELPPIPEGAEALAVCLLHSDLDDSQERDLTDRLASLGLPVWRSSDVSPEFREYERTVTTVVSAHLGPTCRDYLARLATMAGDVLVMTSAGGLVPVDQAAAKPATLLLSGPAGGVQAGVAAATAAGFPDVITFDMGGTSTDVCLVRGGVPEPAGQRTIADLPLRLPALDIHSIGAGGGSIARIDGGGALAVGPQSAGADPGPACYGRQDTIATVTDADLVAGRIPAGTSFPGIGPLDDRAARRALDGGGMDAEGVIAVVDEAMVQALRVVSVQRGVDPRSLALVAFGGAGPLHACALAEALDMAAVVVPPRAGVLSAVGLLCSPRQADVVRSWPTPGSTEGLARALSQLAEHAAETVAAEARADVDVETAVDCRYAGQSHELTVPSPDDFPAEHRRRNGFSRPGAPVEVVALRARATALPPLTVDALGRPRTREPATGPCVLAEPDCTLWVPGGWRAEVGGDGAWVLKR
ncbi:MAG: hydantoinase/oxoprolinase family protein [Actinobacteria bacterium]|nr:MAG: hydantoinase/oxoprolinase family protein [Actinomycetota bacterium]